jgi:hypothetical protein
MTRLAFECDDGKTMMSKCHRATMREKTVIEIMISVRAFLPFGAALSQCVDHFYRIFKAIFTRKSSFEIKQT